MARMIVRGISLGHRLTCDAKPSRRHRELGGFFYGSAFVGEEEMQADDQACRRQDEGVSAASLVGQEPHHRCRS